MWIYRDRGSLETTGDGDPRCLPLAAIKTTAHVMGMMRRFAVLELGKAGLTSCGSLLRYHLVHPIHVPTRCAQAFCVPVELRC